MLVNARIHTLDDAHPVAEALAWDRQGRIIAVGPRSAVIAKAGDAPVHDAKGAVVVPGLIDAHAHLMGLGYALMRADLVGARSPAEVIVRLQAFAAQVAPRRMAARARLGPERLARTVVPDAADLDAAFPSIARLAGAHRRSRGLGEHARRCDGWAATLRRDWQPEGGRIMRAGAGLTGVFIDGATATDRRGGAAPRTRTRMVALRRALPLAAAPGSLACTTWVRAAGRPRRSYRRFADEGESPLRVVAYADGDVPR